MRRERKAGSDRWNAHGTFTAGLHEAFTIVESAGPNVGIQVNFTAIGSASLLRSAARRAHESHRRAHRRLRTIRRSIDIAAQRGAILGGTIRHSRSRDRSRTASARRPARVIEWAWEELSRTRGRVRISDLVREVGWSERHFAVQFRDQIGLAPKALARLMRFAHAVRSLTTDPSPNLADVAQICGLLRPGPLHARLPLVRRHDTDRAPRQPVSGTGRISRRSSVIAPSA